MPELDDLRILKGPKLADRTTIRLGGNAIAEVLVDSPDSFEHLPQALSRLGGSMRLLGEGSNIIAGDGDLPIVIVSKTHSFEPTVREEDATGRVLLKVDAGMRLPALLRVAASIGLSGLEGLTGVPGSVGGSFAMNAGSYGVSMADCVSSVELFSPSTGFVSRQAADFHFAYRSCALPDCPDWFMVSSVTFALQKADKETIRAAMKANYRKKQSTQPVTAKSAGCVFKNPAQGVSAGKLLDEAGLKGKTLGGMRFSPMHANFLVNEGGGTYAAAFDMLELARETILSRFGHRLELEVRLWP
ncbi:UDP-N-acetylmuramate dehydrogenase [Desulfovibrio sp. OttesenSCG-928-G15]|nr:UDP-N-acetylmuramate dehydrogenase [Desulfovibrio sp. OttesenSCG-928-G15]